MSKFVSTGKMAEALGCTYSTVSGYCRDGLFPGSIQTPGGHWRIPKKFFLEALGGNHPELTDSSRPNARNARNARNTRNATAPD